MEDSVTEDERLVLPMNPSSSRGAKEEKHEEKRYEEAKRGGAEERGSGIISSFISNLVSGGGAHEDKVDKDHNGEDRGKASEGKDEEKGGGLIDQLISNLVSPLSPKPGDVTERKVEVFDGENRGRSEVEGGEKEDSGGEKAKGDKANEQAKTEDEGGGGIIDNIISHLPTSLPDAAAPSTEEASILIHSIVHD
ncbi:hypothetical protein L1049_008378 [Liquidambar formosana]|uniref:Uncharacterized protein n=1 Tax=Liquidambar formosana TaxID=63359 RepID=A0AAP0X5K2_LIQFO